MKRRSSKQPTDKKPVVANSELWREIPIGLQGKVRGGTTEDGNFTETKIADIGQGNILLSPKDLRLVRYSNFRQCVKLTFGHFLYENIKLFTTSIPGTSDRVQVSVISDHTNNFRWPGRDHTSDSLP